MFSFNSNTYTNETNCIDGDLYVKEVFGRLKTELRNNCGIKVTYTCKRNLQKKKKKRLLPEEIKLSIKDTRKKEQVHVLIEVAEDVVKI